uniref:Uncharacterized protein n=1 Tax=Nelumbo nucifera TaxID=4432 RepID=A0A822ZRY0_NELNU|nr:TPA_asm: hypothetical protein HUJ06_004405 [Nelumbo nucifera]
MDGHREEILLMDGSGNPLLTMRRKRIFFTQHQIRLRD